MLCFAKDRLYLVERYDEGENEEGRDTTAPVQGHRILVLSLQGDILQVVTHPTEPTALFHSICCFDHTLLAGYTYVTGERSAGAGMLALQGL